MKNIILISNMLSFRISIYIKKTLIISAPFWHHWFFCYYVIKYYMMVWYPPVPRRSGWALIHIYVCTYTLYNDRVHSGAFYIYVWTHMGKRKLDPFPAPSPLSYSLKHSLRIFTLRVRGLNSHLSMYHICNTYIYTYTYIY